LSSKPAICRTDSFAQCADKINRRGYGDKYKYSHSYENNFADQEFLPHDISGTPFYIPGNNSRENGTREFLKNRWKDKYN
jgi:putative ATPase